MKFRPMKVSPIQQLVLVALAPTIALVTGIGFAITRPNTVAVPETVVLQGVSTSTDGSAMPFTFDPNDTKVRGDGTVGVGYEYLANGQVTGDVAGSFSYDEHGYIYLSNPQDPSTMVGSELVSATFTIFPWRASSVPIVIQDSCIACYEHGVEAAAVTDVPPWARGLLSGIAASQSADSGSQPPGGPNVVHYGYFTFSTDQGQFKGYATADFRQFVIQLSFTEPATHS